jgi:hypothetical protein
MSRNPNKTPCQHPGCRSWAMRGHTLCRSHRDPELGPRGSGAPPGNLNALKTGDRAHPLPSLDLLQLAKDLARDPDRLPEHLAVAVDSIHARTHDPYRTLIALSSALGQLVPLVAAQLLAAKADTILQQLPPARRKPFLATLRRTAARPTSDPRLRSEPGGDD